jgi:hypothetical protein
MRPWTVAGVALLALAAPLLAPSQEDGCVRFSGQWGYGRIFEVEARDGLAYYTQGADVIVADVTVPGAPVELGRINLPDYLHGLALGPDVLYVSCGVFNLCVLDVSDATRPVLVNRLPFGGGRAIALEGHFLFYLTNEYLKVLDVSDPTNPLLLASVEHRGGWDIALSGGFAYVVDPSWVDHWGLYVFDVSDPAHPVQVDFQLMQGYRSVKAVGSRLYLGGSSPSLRVFDLADPAHPVEVGSCDPPGTLWEIDVVDGLALLASASGGLQVVDVHDSSAPRELGSYRPPGLSALSVAAAPSRRAFLGTERDGLRELVLEQPDHPQLLGSYQPQRYVGALAAAGDLLAVGDAYVGLRLFDGASGPELPQLGWLETAGVQDVTDLALKGQYAYLAEQYVFEVVDVSDPTSPAFVGMYFTYADLITVVGDRAVVAKWGIEVLDLGEPWKPASLGYVELPPPGGMSMYADAFDLAANATHAYVSIYFYLPPFGPQEYATYAVDISDPVHPVMLWYTQDYGVRGLAICDQYLYVADFSWLVVLDVTDPASPIEIGRVAQVPGSPFDGRLEVEGGLLFALNSETTIGDLIVLDLADPAKPVVVGVYQTGGDASRVAVANGRAYIGDGSAGVHAVDVTACSPFADGFESGDTSAWSATVP